MVEHIPKVKKEYLIATASVVWLLAGVNIMRMGTPDMLRMGHYPLLDIIAAIGTFAVFFGGMFHRLVDKHSRRIMSNEADKMMVLCFFDKKSYLMMGGMIIFGIMLRKAHWLSPPCLGSFYTGLGAALMGAGVFFIIKCSQLVKKTPMQK